MVRTLCSNHKVEGSIHQEKGQRAAACRGLEERKNLGFTISVELKRLWNRLC